MICKKCAHESYCDMALFGGHVPPIVVCPQFKEKSPTNYDRLVSKSPEELAEWLYSLNDEHCDSVCPPTNPACPSRENCVKCWLDWLKEEAT